MTETRILSDIVNRFDVKAIYWNQCYEPWRMDRDKAIKTHLKTKGIYVESTNGSLLWKPWTIKKSDETPYKVFTPFYRKGCLQSEQPHKPISAPDNIRYSRLNLK